MSQQTIGWLPTLREMIQLRSEDEYYDQFGWDRLVVPDDASFVSERMEELNTRFVQRYGNRMLGHETFENWQIRLQNMFDEVVGKYNRAYALYADNQNELLIDIRSGVQRTIQATNEASGSDTLEATNVSKQINTPDSQVNADDNYADSYTKSNGDNTTTYGRKDTNNVTENQEVKGILLENINRTIDDWKDIDTQFIQEFENLFLNVFWY